MAFLKNASQQQQVGMYRFLNRGFMPATLPNASPALSSQKLCTDEFEGDDVYHRGAHFI